MRRGELTKANPEDALFPRPSSHVLAEAAPVAGCPQRMTYCSLRAASETVYQTSPATQRAARVWLGVSPVQLLKARENELVLSNPSRNEISPTCSWELSR